MTTEDLWGGCTLLKESGPRKYLRLSFEVSAQAHFPPTMLRLLALALLVSHSAALGGDGPPEYDPDATISPGLHLDPPPRQPLAPAAGAAGAAEDSAPVQVGPVHGAELYDALYDAYNQLHTYSQQVTHTSSRR